MIPWIQIYSNLPRHPKVTRLADALGLKSACADPNALACGMLVSLWCWAVQNACDGDLSRCTPRAIADACQWKRRPETLTDALRDTGWLDPEVQPDLTSPKVMAQWYCDVFDALIRKTPNQYWWLHRRWREKRKREISTYQSPNQPEISSTPS